MSDHSPQLPNTSVLSTPSRKQRFENLKDTWILRFIYLNGGIAILAVFLIFLFLMKDALPMLKPAVLVKFLTGKEWQPEFDIYGLLPLLAGSVAVTLGAIVIAVPIGIACAVYIAEFAPKPIREILKPTIEVLAGIPSVVIGFLGLTIAAPFIQKVFDLPTGLTALTGSIMLGFMAMPTIISISEDAIVSVPGSYREASLAMGATHWETVRNILVPAAKSGIIAGVMLGIGRAVGETMTVLMVAGNASNFPESVNGLGKFFLGPVRTMTATIAMETGETAQYSNHYHALFAVGLTLFAITFVINLAADLVLRKEQR